MSDKKTHWPFDGFYLKLVEAQREYEQEQHIDPASLTEEERQQKLQEILDCINASRKKKKEVDEQLDPIVPEEEPETAGATPQPAKQYITDDVLVLQHQVTLTTTTLYNGVDMKDRALKYIVSELWNPLVNAQILGRKRPLDEGDTCAVYLLHSFHMPLFFLAAGWVYKEKPIITDIKRRIQTIVVPYFSFGLLILLYWQVIERRFRDSDMSFMNALFGLFSGCYDNLDFNVHLWFLPCFFVTVVLFNILVNMGGRKITYIVSALMSSVYVVLPMPELPWGFNRVFKYIGFYAVGVILAGRETRIVDRKIRIGTVAVALIILNFFLSLHNLTTGFMWFVTAFIGVAAMILISQFVNENRILQYFGRISLMVLCIHGPVYRIVVKIVSVPLHMGTDAVRENVLLAMIVVVATMLICSVVYEVVVRIVPWMVGKKR